MNPDNYKQEYNCMKNYFINMEKFYSLPGETIADHQKQFNLFLQELKQQPEEEIGKFITNLKPGNRQQEIFRVKIVITLGSTNDILKLLKEGDRISTHVLLNKIKNFGKLFETVSADNLINNICPYLSYINRRRLINKLSYSINDVNKGEEYYKSLNYKYGLVQSTPLLISCSEEFIKQIVTMNAIRFNNKQLISLHKKFNTFLIFYFKTIKNPNFSRYNSLAQYLSVNSLKTFWSLLEFGVPLIGRKGARNVIKNYKNDVIREPYVYKFIKPRLLIKELNADEYKELFENTLPDTFRFSETIKRYLKAVPKPIRFKLLTSSFKNVYGFDFNHSLPLDIFSIEDQRIIVKHIDNYDQIKEQINLTPNVQIRRGLIEKLLETCRLYNDQSALLEILKYFNTRHKYDEKDIRIAFLVALSDKFNLNELSEQHWDYISDLLKVFETNNEIFYAKAKFLSARLLWKMERNMSYDEDLKILMMNYKRKGMETNWKFVSSTKYERLLILRCADFLEEIFDYDIEIAIYQFMRTVYVWNLNNPKEKISYYQYKEYIYKFLIENEASDLYSWYNNVFNDIFLFKPTEQDEIEIKNELITAVEFYLFLLTDKTLIWFLKNHTQIVFENLDEIYDRANGLFFYEISKMHYHPIHFKCRKLAFESLKYDIEKGLIFLCHEKDFLKTIQRYIPRKDSNVPKSDIIIYSSILKYLKKFTIHHDSIEVILHFCEKDHKRYALQTLYYCLSHSKEISIIQPISQIGLKSVTIRKHAISLTTLLGSTQYIIITLTNMIENEKNTSVRQFMLKNTYKALIKQSSDDLWTLLQAQIKTLNPNDEETIYLLKQIKPIPIKFLSDYLKEFWNYLKKCSDDTNLIILDLINHDTINIIPEPFCIEVIQKTLFKKGSIKLITKYLFSNHSNLDNRQKLIFEIISNANANNIYTLFNSISRRLIEKPDCTIEFVSKLHENFNKLNLPFTKLELQLKFEILTHYLKSDESMKELASIFVNLQNDIISRFGLEIFEFYSDSVYELLNMAFSEHEGDRIFSFLELCEEMLLVKDSDWVKLFVIKLLPSRVTDNDEFNQRRVNLMVKIEENSSNTVKIYLIKFRRRFE